MDNKIEYIDKSVLTGEQKNEIEEILNNKYEKMQSITFTIILLINILLIIGYFIATIGYGIEKNDIFIMLQLVIFMNLILSPAIIFINKFNPKYYEIVKAKVIEKKKLFYQQGSADFGNHLCLAKIINKDSESTHIVDNELYRKLKLKQERVYVFLGKKNNNKIKGTIALDITDMIEE